MTDREAEIWGGRKNSPISHLSAGSGNSEGVSQCLAPLSRGWNGLSSLRPLILYSILLLLGWKEMLHLHKKRQRGRASEFTSEKSTDSQR